MSLQQKNKEEFRLKYVNRIVISMMVVILFVGCSSGNKGAKESAVKDVDATEQKAIEEFEDELGIDLDEIEEEMGIDKESTEIPEDIPSDAPIPEDMEMEMTIDNELMAQARMKTEQSIDELKGIYEEYLNSNTFSASPTTDNYEMEGFYSITYITEYNDREFSIQIYHAESDGDIRTVVLSIL